MIIKIRRWSVCLEERQEFGILRIDINKKIADIKVEPL